MLAYTQTTQQKANIQVIDYTSVFFWVNSAYSNCVVQSFEETDKEDLYDKGAHVFNICCGCYTTRELVQMLGACVYNTHLFFSTFATVTELCCSTRHRASESYHEQPLFNPNHPQSNIKVCIKLNNKT